MVHESTTNTMISHGQRKKKRETLDFMGPLFSGLYYWYQKTILLYSLKTQNFTWEEFAYKYTNLINFFFFFFFTIKTF